MLLYLIYYNPKCCSPGADASFLVPGFFVDINLFKADKERAAEIARNSKDLLKDVNGSNGTLGKDGLADEDANLMIKLKFLTYKVCIIQSLSEAMETYKIERCSCLSFLLSLFEHNMAETRRHLTRIKSNVLLGVLLK